MLLFSLFSAVLYVSGPILFLLLLRAHRTLSRRAASTNTNGKKDQASHYPPISVLTSLRGPTPQMEEALHSLLHQTYPGEIEFVIATKDAYEPLIAEAQAIFKAYKGDFARRLVRWVSPVDTTGANPRTAKIAKAFEAATHDWVFMTCLDTRLGLLDLQQMMDQADSNPTHYVTTFPIIEKARNLGSKLEAVALNLDVAMFFIFSFWLGKPAAYGGALLFHKKLLSQAGGWSPIIPLLTDDITLARAFQNVGGKGHLAHYPSFVKQETQSFRSYWQRQVRWRMISKYFLKGLFYLTPITWIPFVFAVLGIRNSLFLKWALGCYAVRVCSALIHQRLQQTSIRDSLQVYLLPVADLIGITAWFVALFSKSVHWSGLLLRLNAQGEVRTPLAQRPL